MRSQLFFAYLFTFFWCGVLTSVAGFLGWLYPPFSLIILIPLLFLISWMWQMVVLIPALQRGEKFLIAALVTIWLLHLLGVFVPETGFDAVWYHLPIVAEFAKLHRVVYLPDFYQSLNPLWSDLIFLHGYQLAGEIGAKFVAYMFGVSFLFVSYQLAREVMNRQWTLISVLIISTFQVVAWQSSSFYVDIAKAFWEIAAVWLLVRVLDHCGGISEKIWSALFFGASLATKLFSLFLLPVFAINIFFPLSLFVALPFYVFAFQHTGNPFYSFDLHTAKLGEIGGATSLGQYLWQRTLFLPTSLTELTLFSRDYTSLLFLVFAPIFVMNWRKMISSRPLLFLLFFAAAQWIIWWYIPPLSTRYALSGFAVLAILYVFTMKNYIDQRPRSRSYMYITITLSLLFALLPRFFVAQRQLRYLSGQQTKRQYIEQFYDGWIDEKLKIWHHL